MFRKQIFQALALLIGVFSAAFGVSGFLLPNGFIDGGVTGISMLVSVATKIELSALLVIINIPFVLLGYQLLGRKLAIRASIGIIALAVILHAVHFPVVTEDKLLAAVFGGFFLGAGIGLAMRASAVLDGTEIVAFIAGKRLGFTVGDIVLGINIVIFSTATVLLGVESALYSILAYISASRMVDFLIHGLEEFNSLLIVSEKSEEIRQAVVHTLGRGMTVLKGERGLTEEKQNILLCVVTRFEINKIRDLVNDIDDSAFVIVQKLSDTSGGMVKRRLGTAELH